MCVAQYRRHALKVIVLKDNGTPGMDCFKKRDLGEVSERTTTWHRSATPYTHVSPPTVYTPSAHRHLRQSTIIPAASLLTVDLLLFFSVSIFTFRFSLEVRLSGE